MKKLPNFWSENSYWIYNKFTEFLKKSDWVGKLYFIDLGGRIGLIISFERFSFILYSSIPRLWMFLWWIVKQCPFWSNSWNELMVSLYTICSVRSCKWLIFLFSTLPWNIQTSGQLLTGLKLRNLLGLSFVLESYNLTILLKQAI